MDNQPVECCPSFDPTSWDEKLLEWNNKRFIKASVFTLFYIPLNFGGVMRKLDAAAREAGAKVQDNLCLSEHTSKWNMDLYLAVDAEVPGIENVVLSGKFYSKVYEGDFKNISTWCKDFETIVKGKGISVQKQYLWYTTCPTCAKKWGENYVVIISKIDS